MVDVSVLTLTRNLTYLRRLTASLNAAIAQIPGVRVERLLVNNGAPARRPAEDATRSRAAGRGWAVGAPFDRPRDIHAAARRKGRADTTRWASAHGWKVIDPGYNSSFSAGNNLAAKAARGSHLLLVNDDVELRPDGLLRLWQRRESADVLGCLIVQRDRRTVNHAGTFVLPWPGHIGRGDPVRQWERDMVERRESVTFACVLIRTRHYQRLGGLDERYCYSFEDTDFCLRTIEAGGTIGVALSAVAYHDEAGTRQIGGPNDLENARVYRKIWERRVADIVERYRARAGT